MSEPIAEATRVFLQGGPKGLAGIRCLACDWAIGWDPPSETGESITPYLNNALRHVAEHIATFEARRDVDLRFIWEPIGTWEREGDWP